jgi:hypothetical protein
MTDIELEPADLMTAAESYLAQGLTVTGEGAAE